MSRIDRFRAGLVEYMRMYQIILGATGKEPIMATQVELYKRIKNAMMDDAEVVELCDKFISRNEKQNETVQNNIEMVRKALCEIEADSGEAMFTSKEVSRMVTLMNAGESWNVRKAASYLARLVRDGVLVKVDVPKGQPTTYTWSD